MIFLNYFKLNPNAYKIITFYQKGNAAASTPRFSSDVVQGKKLLITKIFSEKYVNVSQVGGEMYQLTGSDNGQQVYTTRQAQARIQNEIFGKVDSTNSKSQQQYYLKINGIDVYFTTDGANVAHPFNIDSDNFYLRWDQPINKIEFGGWCKPDGVNYCDMILGLGVYIL